MKQQQQQQLDLQGSSDRLAVRRESAFVVESIAPAVEHNASTANRVCERTR